MNGIPKSLPPLGIVKSNSRAVNIPLMASDLGAMISITSGTFTQTFDGSIADGWHCYLKNAGSGDITIPSSDGLTNWIMYPGELRLLQYEAGTFSSFVLQKFVRTFTTTSTFIKPPGYLAFWCKPKGGDGGGGGGQGLAAGNARSGGGGGGGGGAPEEIILSSSFGATETVTIGAGGLGGTGGVAGNGANGTAGGNTSIGTLIYGYGGGYGSGGTVAGGSGGGGGGRVSAGANGVSGVTSAQSSPKVLCDPLGGIAQTANNAGTGGAGDFFNAEYGGAGARGSSLHAGAGGGNGGYIDAANSPTVSSNGGAYGSYVTGGGGLGGAGSAGAAGAAGAASGAGGGGGAPNTAGTGGAGGAGTNGGGGGGGAGTSTGGAGGAGGAGYCIIMGVA